MRRWLLLVVEAGLSRFGTLRSRRFGPDQPYQRRRSILSAGELRSLLMQGRRRRMDPEVIRAPGRDPRHGKRSASSDDTWSAERQAAHDRTLHDHGSLGPLRKAWGQIHQPFAEVGNGAIPANRNVMARCEAPTMER